MSRVYIREDDPVGNRFYTDGTIDVARLKECPALLVTETGGDGYSGPRNPDNGLRYTLLQPRL
jgi:hypothetical protein